MALSTIVRRRRTAPEVSSVKVVGATATGARIVGFSQGITNFGPEDEALEERIHLRPGDAVVHWGNTIHRAQPNRTQDRHRRAFAVVYRGVSCRRDEASHARYLAALKAQHEALGLKT